MVKVVKDKSSAETPASEAKANGKSKRTPPPANESKRDKFLRLAPARTDAVLRRIKQLSNLAGSGYEWEPGEVQQMLDAVFDAVHDMKRKFERKRQTTSKGFSFASPKQRRTDKQLNV
jgi:hypothetical protein